MKKITFLSLLIIVGFTFIYASGDGSPIPKSNMSVSDYNKYIMFESLNKFESQEQFYRTIYLLLQTIAVIFSLLIPILLNSIIDEKRRKKIISILSICVAIAVGATSVFKFNAQSTFYGNGAAKLRLNFMKYDTNMGVYSEIKHDSIKVNTYKYSAEEIIYQTRKGLIESLPKEHANLLKQ